MPIATASPTNVAAHSAHHLRSTMCKIIAFGGDSPSRARRNAAKVCVYMYIFIYIYIRTYINRLNLTLIIISSLEIPIICVGLRVRITTVREGVVSLLLLRAFRISKGGLYGTARVKGLCRVLLAPLLIFLRSVDAVG